MAEGLLLLWAAAGALGGSLLALVPALHIYNLAGFFLLLCNASPCLVPPETIAFLFIGMVTGYAMLNAVPSIYLSIPDESTIFVVLPGQKYLLQRRGHEAVVLTGLGGLGGIAILALLTPIASAVLPRLRAILQPHLPWIAWAIIAYLLLSEWPKGAGRAPAGLRRWWEGWRSLIAGLATFLLSGVLGLIVIYRSPIAPRAAYQNLLPAFVGLFAVPWVLQNVAARTEIPPQYHPASVDAGPDHLLRGTLAGSIGGLFAAFFPLVTGGIGALLAGQATAQQDERTFLISQGACKVIYYVGGLLLFFVPGLQLVRGGMAAMLSTRYSSATPETYLLASAAVVLAGVLSFFLSLGLSRLLAWLLARVHYRPISIATLGILATIVLAATGPAGLLLCAVASGIGLIPVLWGSRRTNCMGLLLLPIGLNMVGVGDRIAGWLGLL